MSATNIRPVERRDLHASFGFKPVGSYTEVGRKFGKYWDVAWMQRPLRVSSGS